MWTRIALYTTLGYVIDGLGAHWDTWQFWAVLALFWASETMTRTQLLEQLQEEVAAVRRARGERND